MDAGIEIDGHRWVAWVGFRFFFSCREAARCQIYSIGPLPEFRVPVMSSCPARLIGREHLNNYGPGLASAIGFGVYDHPFGWLAQTGCSEYPFAFNLNHAGSAIAVGTVARLRRVTKMGYFRSLACRDFPDGFVRRGGDIATVEYETNKLAHVQLISCKLPGRRESASVSQVVRRRI